MCFLFPSTAIAKIHFRSQSRPIFFRVSKDLPPVRRRPWRRQRRPPRQDTRRHLSCTNPSILLPGFMSSLGSLPPLGWVKKTKKILRQQTSNYRADAWLLFTSPWWWILRICFTGSWSCCLSVFTCVFYNLKNFWLDFLFPKDNLCQPPLWPTELELGVSQTLSTPPFPGICRLKHSHRSNPHVLKSQHPLSYFWSVMVKSSIATKKLREQNSSLIKKFHFVFFNSQPSDLLSLLENCISACHSCSILVGWLSIEMVSTARCTYEKVNHLCT